MTASLQRLWVLTIVLAMSASATAQVLLPAPVSAGLLTPQSFLAENSDPAPLADGSQALLAFEDSDVKFSLANLMSILRDHKHEGWVLAAYPDPNTRRPLIGAGFSLDVQATEHLQTDDLNSHPFVEPSSAQLWQAAGLAPDRLQRILDQFDRNAKAWSAKTYRRKIYRKALTPQLTDEEATQLLRISVIQAIYNARAYCRGFDQLTASQQMAFTQLVFQMGTNLQQFVEFLGTVNDTGGSRELARLDGYLENDAEHWKSVQGTLMDSQWARKYTVRAAAVIAMFDPAYSVEPGAAEERIASVLRPPVAPSRKIRSAATLRVASYSKRSGRSHGRKAGRSQVKPRLT
jgi:hypothetical protein